MGIKKEVKGVFFSIDALIALLIVFLTILIIYPKIIPVENDPFIERDIINVLSNLKIGELSQSDPEIKALIKDVINDSNKNILETIFELYIIDKSKARTFTERILTNFNFSENVGIWINNNYIASKNNSLPIENASDISVERQILSGFPNISQDSLDGPRGYAAKA